MEKFIEIYLKLLNSQFEGLNLTRIKNPAEFKSKQYLDSVALFNNWPNLAKIEKTIEAVVDIGFGGGFPILPLAYENPLVKFIGIESKKKKINAVRILADALEIKNINLVHQNLEHILFDLNVLVTFKAVGSIKKMLSMLHVLNGVEVFVAFYKGPKLEELEQIDAIENWKLIDDYIYYIGENQRRLLIYRNVPRRTIKNKAGKKQLVKVSQFI